MYNDTCREDIIKKQRGISGLRFITCLAIEWFFIFCDNLHVAHFSYRLFPRYSL